MRHIEREKDPCRNVWETSFAFIKSSHPLGTTLRYLLAVHCGQSFLAAGKALGVATSTVARRVDALERALGRRLVHRGNGGARIEPDALALVALGEQMDLGIEALRRVPGARLPRRAAAQHDWVGFDRALERLPQEQWMRAYGASRFVFRSSSSAAIEEALLSGVGVGLLGEVQGSALESLVRLGTDEAPPSVEVFLVFHRDARTTPRVRAVVRALDEEIRRMK